MTTSRRLLRVFGLFLAMAVSTGFLWAQSVEITPATNTIPRGGTVTLNVNITGVTSLLASHVKVTFDNTKLQYNGAANGTFMPAGSFFSQNLNANEVSVDQSTLSNPAVSGSGLLFTISFTALDAVSASSIGLAVDLRDAANTPIPAGTTGSSVTIENPLPGVTSIAPTVKTSGDPTFDLAVTGSNFVPTSVVWFKGVARTTTYNSATSLSASIPAADIVQAGLFPVTVVNPAPGGGTSVEVVNLQVVAGAAANIALSAGAGQSAIINSTLPVPFEVLVTDAGGNAVSGTSVTFALGTVPPSATGQALSTLSVSTDANGHASTTLTLGNKVGTYAVTASSTGLLGSPVTFSATATVGAAATMTMTSGDGQTAGIGTALANPFVVTVTDIGGNVVQGTSVTFAIATTPASATGQSVSNGTIMTDANGQASTTLTLGNKVGNYAVTATSGTLNGSPVTFTATATTGSATTITMTSGDGQSATINSVLPTPFVVTITDAGGNPVSGTDVLFAINSAPASATGQALSGTAVTTDVNGQASTILTLGSKVGSYHVTATSGTLTNSPILFSATATVGNAAAITLTSGNSQTGSISTSLADPFVVTVTDAGGNPVSGTTVAFGIVAAPALAAGQVLSVTSVLTDAGGQASTTLTLGDKVGGYSVTASSTGLSGSPVTFSATATAGALHHFSIGAIGPQTSGTSFDLLVTAQDIGNNTVTGFAGTVALSISTGTIAPATSGSFAAGQLTQPVTVTGTGTGVFITVDDLAGHTASSNPFNVSAMPGLFVSADPAAPAASVVFANDAMATTSYEANDWTFVGGPIVTVYIVPEPGMTFSTSSVTLSWDATALSLASVDFGSAGSPNGIVGNGQLYTHAESFDQSLGANTVTVNASRTGGSDFPTIVAGDYIARVDFHLLKPGHAPVTIQASSFLRLPANTVQVTPHAGAIKAYLGDVASASVGVAAGDGVIDFSDLAPWSVSYWSGVPGYPGGMTNYKVKYDFGPTADGSVFTLPHVDGKVDFEDLVIFSIGYGLSATHQLPKVATPSKEPVLVSLDAPVVSGTETRIAVLVGGAVSDIRAMRLELKGQFGEFLGVEKGSLLKEYDSPVALLSRSADGKVYVDLAVMGLDAHGLSRSGDVVVLKFAGTPAVQLTANEARTSGNQPLPVQKIRGAGEAVPTTYALKQNYPNPFNPTTTISYDVPATGEVTLTVYNMLGQRVATLVQEVKEAGFYQVLWNGKDEDQRTVASGIFFYRLQAGKFSDVKKMLLLK